MVSPPPDFRADDFLKVRAWIQIRQSGHAPVRAYFNLERHLYSREIFKIDRGDAMAGRHQLAARIAGGFVGVTMEPYAYRSGEQEAGAAAQPQRSSLIRLLAGIMGRAPQHIATLSETCRLAGCAMVCMLRSEHVPGRHRNAFQGSGGGRRTDRTGSLQR